MAITAEKLLAQVHAKDEESWESFRQRGEGTDLSSEIQLAISQCPELIPMLRAACSLPVQCVFGLGIELGYAIAQAEQLEVMLSNKEMIG